VSDTDGTDKKPEPQRTVAWNPDDVPGLQDEATPSPGATSDTSGMAPTQKMPAHSATGSTPTRKLPLQGDAPVAPEAPAAEPVDPGATIAITPEDIERLKQESEAKAEESDRLIGTLIRDKWKVLERLGAGSFGTVYKVEDVTGGWIEALKILGVDRLTGAEAEEMQARFLREAQIMKRLGKDSKHIVGLSTYEEDFEAGLIYFLMELVEGPSLADALNSDGPFSVDRTVKIALQACDALMAAHEGPEPVVHRDLKLENLMLTTDRSGDEMVKVLDFGIAKIAEREADSRLTTVGTLGTPGYAAPEQLRAEAVDGRTDLFSFGVILYALLTGRDPWLGNLAHEPTHQIYELMVATDRAEVRPMSDSGVAVPPAMANIVMKLLRRDPAQRFQSARELRDALLRVKEGGAGVDTGSLRILTDDEGVHVEIRDGRTLVAEGPTPCTANGIPAATYTVSVRDPRYDPTETTVALGSGAMQDITLVTSKRAPGSGPRPTPRTGGSGKGRIAAGILLLLAGGATAFAQPWGRTLDEAGLFSAVDAGTVDAVWVVDGGSRVVSDRSPWMHWPR